jgi:hypothetical protein
MRLKASTTRDSPLLATPKTSSSRDYVCCRTQKCKDARMVIQRAEKQQKNKGGD